MSAGRGEERFAAGREEGEGKDEQATRSPGGARSTMGPAGAAVGRTTHGAPELRSRNQIRRCLAGMDSMNPSDVRRLPLDPGGPPAAFNGPVSASVQQG